MTTNPDHHPPADHVSRVRGQIGAAAACSSDLLDLLTAGLAEDDRHTPPDQPPEAAHERSERDAEAAYSDGGGSR